ncbi:MAG TPA: hypothetical protein VHE35_02365 [Kofleriaceae bacterium]|nr:hypothetical protein [Kofleriaceae bacterium]
MSDKTKQVTVIDVGKQKKRAIKDLKAGGGPLASEVLSVAAAVDVDGSGGGSPARNTVPVVFLFEKKKKKTRGGGLAAQLLRRLK